MDQQQATTVVIADAHAIVREGVVNLCLEFGLRVVGQCADSEAAIDLITTLKPDFAILEVQGPRMNGIEAIHKLRSEGCTTKLMVLTLNRDERTFQAALE